MLRAADNPATIADSTRRAEQLEQLQAEAETEFANFVPAFLAKAF